MIMTLMHGEIYGLTCNGRHSSEVVFESEVTNDFPSTRPDTYPCTDLCKLTGRLVDVDFEVGRTFVEGDGETQSADSAAAISKMCQY